MNVETGEIRHFKDGDVKAMSDEERQKWVALQNETARILEQIPPEDRVSIYEQWRRKRLFKKYRRLTGKNP